MRVRLDISYVGTRYVGWQLQPNGLSIQEVLERALEKLYGQPVPIVGAGRTDAGVHARGQTAHFDAPRANPPIPELCRILNRFLPVDISVNRARAVPPAFHARKDAISRTYLYRIFVRPLPDPFRAPYVWHYPPAAAVSIARMRQAARRWIGTHDFAAFGIRLAEDERTKREMKRVEIRRIGDEIQFIFTADSFLHRMVRRMVAYLVETGMGKRVTRPPYAAPASGLCLVKVGYGRYPAARRR